MTSELENAIRAACAEAIASLGDNYKGLSGFLYNWKSGSELEKESLDPLAA